MKYRQVSILWGQLSITIDKYRYFPIHENSEKTLGNFEKRMEGKREFWNLLKKNGKTKKNCGQFFEKFWKYCRKHPRNFENIF